MTSITAHETWSSDDGSPLPRRATEAVRVCRVCGTRKSVGEFKIHEGNRMHTCRSCFNLRIRGILVQRSLQNKELYGTAYSPRRQAMQRGYYATRSVANRELYGTALKPARIEQHRQYLGLRRLKVVGLYGGKCECCDENNVKLLTFDHIRGGGRKLRSCGHRLVGQALYEFERSGYPNSVFRLLCFNCNAAMGQYKYCPHRGESRVLSGNELKQHKHYIRRLKMETIKAYGGECVFCREKHWEFLTIDHVNGGGSAERERLGGGTKFYLWLKRWGWPKDDYQLLCFNCNLSKER